MSAVLAALLLFASTLVVWFVARAAPPAVRVQLRFAAILFAALAAGAVAPPQAASAVALLVLPLALGVLALAAAGRFVRAVPSVAGGLLLAAICLAALAAAITGFATLALVPGVGAIFAIGLICAGRFADARLAGLQGAAAALSFLAAAAAFARDGAGAPLLLFCAAGLLGLTLALSRSGVAVAERAGADLRDAPIGHRKA
ncbi:MAG: hypothetical protein WDM91_21070 [Rhizomicrobium sp.]